jgi:hypothetical protein
VTSTAERYLALLKKSLLDELYLENEAKLIYFAQHAINGTAPRLAQVIEDFRAIQSHGIYEALRESRKVGGWIPFSRVEAGKTVEIKEGRNFTFTAHTMIGRARLDNLHLCLDAITRDAVPGDLIETGAWRGGATIFMRGYLAAHGISGRSVWVADSFEGLPPPSHEKDQGWDFSSKVFPYLAVSLEDVKALFQRYELLDDQVRFLKGWFRDTLPKAPIERLALLRMDGDLYESTMDALNNLYPRLSPGGFAIVDDYFSFPQCKDAVHEYRERHRIDGELVRIDHDAVYWRRAN